MYNVLAMNTQTMGLIEHQPTVIDRTINIVYLISRTVIQDFQFTPLLVQDALP